MTNPRRTPFRPPGRMLAVVLSVAVVAMASPALADPADTDSTSASSGSGAGALAATAAAAGPGSSAVTLVTGDRVAFTGVGADVQVTGVTPAPDRERIGFTRYHLNGHEYVLPTDAEELVDGGTVDEALFDITGLVALGYDDKHSTVVPVLAAGQQLKRALMGSANSTAQAVDAVGAGVVDIGKAITQTLVADTGALDLGTVGADAAPITRTVTVTNTGSAEVVADVSARLSTSPVGDSPAGLVSVSPEVVTLPAGGSAELTLTVQPAGTSIGVYNGHLKVTPREAPATFLRVPMVLDHLGPVVHVKVLGANGGPAIGALVHLLNLDDGGVTPVTTGADGTVNARVAAGRYAAITTINMAYGDGRALGLLTADKPADSNEMLLDARDARDYSLGVDGEDLRQDFLNGNLIRTTVDGKRAIVNGIIAGGAYGAFAPHEIRIVPTTGMTPGTTVLSEHWRLADAASDHNTGDTKVQYDLAFVRDTVADQPVVLSAVEKAKLARIDATWKGMGEAQRIQEDSVPYLDGGFGLNWTSPSFLALPQNRTEYVTGGDVVWLSHTYRWKDSMELRFDGVYKQYPVSSRQKETWYGGPYTTAAVGQVWKDAMQLRLVEAVDSDGRYGRYGDFRFPQVTKRTLSVTRNGAPASLKALGGNTYELAMPDREPAKYAIRSTFTAQNGFPLGGEGATTWTFSAAGGAAEPTAVSVPNVRYDIKLDDLNRARADHPLPVRVSVTGTAGRVVDAHAEYTADGGATWHQLPATDSEGQYEFEVPKSALVSGGYLGLRFVATDEAGNSVDMSLPRAVAVA